MPEKEVKFTSKRKFGVELEFDTYKNQRDLADVVQNCGEPCEIVSYQHNRNNRDWFAKPDSSCGFELASRVLSGYKDLRKLGEVVDALRVAGFRYNNSCGQHVHISAEDLTNEEINSVIYWWLKIEHFIFNSCESHRRENQRYCKAAGQIINTAPLTWNPYERNDFNVIQKIKENRGAIYLGHLPTTIEFRLGHMSLDSEIIKNRVRFLIWFVDTCKNTPYPISLEWLPPIEIFKFLGLWNEPNSKIIRKFSPSIQSMRLWLLNEFKKNAPSANSETYKQDHEMVDYMKQHITNEQNVLEDDEVLV